MNNKCSIEVYVGGVLFVCKFFETCTLGNTVTLQKMINSIGKTNQYDCIS